MRNILLSFISVATFFTVSGQVLEVDNLKNMKAKDLVKFNGGININSIFYSGNGGVSRAPFTYFINGSLNTKIANLIDVPISFAFSNTGKNFNLPTAPSRLGLHPKYKFVTGHLGDVSMVFSPYTLNGYLFRGVGVDVEPEGKLHVSAMAGRLQKAAEYDSTNQIVPAAYQRFGYGTKLTFRKKQYRLGMIVFAAKDNVNSLNFKPDSLNIQPKQNLVLSWTGAFMPITDAELTFEYASSALTHDLRDTFEVVKADKKLVDIGINRNNSTSFYNALKANFNYKYKNSVLGIGYERVDPGYETLGAYYFNNDLENFTVNVAQPFSKSKGQLSANVGLQRDNLGNNKLSSNKRLVYAVNMNYMPAKKLMTTFNYSNFTSYQRILPLFQNLNQSVTPYANLDTLNYSQISRSANANVNYILQQSDKKLQNLNTNISYQNVSDIQGGIKQFGSNSRMFSFITSYSISFIPQEMSITGAVNATTNKIGGTDLTMMGSTLSFSKKFMKKLNSSVVVAYNTISGAASEGSVIITRINANYPFWKKHNINLSVMNQNRNLKALGTTTNDLVVTAGYNYFF